MSKFTKEARDIPERHGFDSDTRVAGGYGAYAGLETPKKKLHRMASMFYLGPKDTLYYRETGNDEYESLASRIVYFVEAGYVTPEDAFDVAQNLAKEGVRHGPALITIGLIKAGASHLVRKLDPQHILGTPTQAADLLAMWRLFGNKKHRYPHALTDLIAKRFPDWDEYQLRKHYGEDPFTVKAMLKLAHPKPRDEGQSNLWGNITIKGKKALPVPLTWETAISKAGRNVKARRKAWLNLMDKKKLPTLATIRNLRNMLSDGVPGERIVEYVDSLNPRYLSVFNIMKAMAITPEFSFALERLMKRYWRLSDRRLPGLTEIIIDVSGSMGGIPRNLAEKGILGNSFLSRAVAVAYSIMLAAEEYRIIFTAGDDDEGVHASYKADVSRNIRDLLTATVDAYSDLGYGGIFTNQVLKWANKNFPQPDRVVVISDSQDIEDPDRVLERVDRAKHMVEVNIAPYTYVNITDQTHGGRWTVIDGFSDPVPYIIAAEKSI